MRELAGYWREARGQAIAPRIADIDPSRFARLLPAIWMCDVVDNDPRRRFRYRLIGDHVRVAYGENIVGRTLEELTVPSAIERVVGYFAVCADPAVVHMTGRLFAESERPASGERLLLPFLSNDGSRVSRILGATLHSWALERGRSLATAPAHQIRTFIPANGGPAWCEDWLETPAAAAIS
ncbi:MAG: PAS domain-containing protein [Minwuia sp.]|uniref:PAS domain-containing protein n=1 Tax=Minwuia sp. TaxID=2493630 RepID=UPI003A8C2992